MYCRKILSKKSDKIFFLFFFSQKLFLLFIKRYIKILTVFFVTVNSNQTLVCLCLSVCLNFYISVTKHKLLLTVNLICLGSYYIIFYSLSYNYYHLNQNVLKEQAQLKAISLRERLHI